MGSESFYMTLRKLHFENLQFHVSRAVTILYSDLVRNFLVGFVMNWHVQGEAKSSKPMVQLDMMHLT